MEMQFGDYENVKTTMPHFVISGTFPTLNEYLAACGRNPKAGSRMKKQYLEIASWEIRSQLKNYHTDNKIILHYVIYEPNMKRDKDNVFCMVSKCVSDALQVCKVIDNDGWKNIENFTHDFFLDRNNPRIEVYIEEVSNNGMG